MVVEGISSFVATASCKGFIVRSIATTGLLSLTETYAKASKTATVRSWSTTCGPLINGPPSSLAWQQRMDRASRKQDLEVNVAAVSETTASTSTFLGLNLPGSTSTGANLDRGLLAVIQLVWLLLVGVLVGHLVGVLITRVEFFVKNRKLKCKEGLVARIDLMQMVR